VVLIGQAGRRSFGVLLSIVGIGRGCNSHGVSRRAELWIKTQVRFLSCSPKQDKKRQRFWKGKKKVNSGRYESQNKNSAKSQAEAVLYPRQAFWCNFLFFVLRFPRTECADESLEDCGSLDSSSCEDSQASQIIG
jgi:hypothetical protein